MPDNFETAAEAELFAELEDCRSENERLRAENRRLVEAYGDFKRFWDALDDPDGAEHWADLRFLLDAGTPVALTIAGVTYALSDLSSDRRTAFFTADDPHLFDTTQAEHSDGTPDG